jgi:hypothetical protein
MVQNNYNFMKPMGGYAVPQGYVMQQQYMMRPSDALPFAMAETSFQF